MNCFENTEKSIKWTQMLCSDTIFNLQNCPNLIQFQKIWKHMTADIRKTTPEYCMCIFTSDRSIRLLIITIQNTNRCSK